MAWDALVGRKAKGDYYDPRTWEVFLQREEQINREIADRLEMFNLAAVEAELQGLTFSDEPLKQWEGWGEYKTAAARAVLRLGEGELRVNGQPMWEYFKRAPRKTKGFLHRLTSLDEVAELLARMDVVVWVWGSSSETMRQAKAAAHAIAKALMDYDGRRRWTDNPGSYPSYIDIGALERGSRFPTCRRINRFKQLGKKL